MRVVGWFFVITALLCVGTGLSTTTSNKTTSSAPADTCPATGETGETKEFKGRSGLTYPTSQDACFVHQDRLLQGCHNFSCSLHCADNVFLRCVPRGVGPVANVFECCEKNIGLIVGLAIGGTLLIIATAGLIWYLVWFFDCCCYDMEEEFYPYPYPGTPGAPPPPGGPPPPGAPAPPPAKEIPPCRTFNAQLPKPSSQLATAPTGGSFPTPTAGPQTGAPTQASATPTATPTAAPAATPAATPTIAARTMATQGGPS